MVMATGIVAIDCHILGLRELAHALFWVSLLTYGFLCALLVVRVALFPGRIASDVSSHQRGPGFFTIVAATSVLGTELVVFQADLFLARVAWWMTLCFWGICTYSVFFALSVKEKKPTLQHGINGGWLVAVVATQSVTVLGAMLGGNLLGSGDATFFVLTSFWLCGGMLYVWMISLIFYRYLFFDFRPEDLMPPYWINMGAVAISTLAGALLVTTIPQSPALAPLAPFLKGITLTFWATATWWLPMLLILGVWRHGIKKFRFRYDPLYWGLVFPLGMYSVCTYRLMGILNLPFLAVISKIFLVGAVVAWLLTFFAMAQRFLVVPLLAIAPRKDGNKNSD